MIKNFKLFEMIKKQYVADVTDWNIPKKVKDKVYNDARERGYGNNSYIYYYVCDSYKPVSEVKDVNNIVIEDNNGYCYENGDDIISDWFLEQGIKPGEEVLFKIWW